MSRIYPGDYGILITYEIASGLTAQQVTDATLIEFTIISPETGSINTVTATRNVLQLQYTTLPGEIEEAGDYEIWPWLQWGSVTGKWLDPMYLSVTPKNEKIVTA